jgi:hypothetical protein
MGDDKRKIDEVDSDNEGAEGATLTKKQKKQAREEKRKRKQAEAGVVEEEVLKSTESSTNDKKEKKGKKEKKDKKDEVGAQEQQDADEAWKEHSKKLAKMLPTRAEKARRDQQKKIQAFVLDLKAKGITDPKQVKNEKLKYKKLLEMRGARKNWGRR